MKTSVANSWEDLQALLFDGSWNEGIQRYRSPFVFRGLPHHEFNLETSLMRLQGDYPSLEKHLLRNFQKYGHDSFSANDSLWHWLTMAQHHGLPTRLLDWTYSPFVSMHFATANLRYVKDDAVIWKVNYHDAYAQLPLSLRQLLDREGGNVFTTDMLSSLVNSLDEFETLSPENFFIFFEPPAIDARIINQHALFSVTSKSSQVLDDLLAGICCERIIIPQRLKWEVRDKLDQANITERVLFPGLEGLSQWLKRHYTSHEV